MLAPTFSEGRSISIQVSGDISSKSSKKGRIKGKNISKNSEGIQFFITKYVKKLITISLKLWFKILVYCKLEKIVVSET